MADMKNWEIRSTIFQHPVLYELRPMLRGEMLFAVSDSPEKLIEFATELEGLLTKFNTSEFNRLKRVKHDHPS